MAWDRLKKDQVAIVCSVVILFFILVAIFAPFLTSLQAPDPTTGTQGHPRTRSTPIWSTERQLPPSACRPPTGSASSRGSADLFARWAYGARPSLVIGFTAAAASTIIGVTLGLLAGYISGATDRAISWIIDFFLSLPLLLLVLAIVPIMQKSFAAEQRPLGRTRLSAIRFFVLIVDPCSSSAGWRSWPASSRRGQSLREREFVQAARAIGVPTRQILFQEILPNLVGPIIVSASIAFRPSSPSRRP